jgi:DNA-binding NtrC family response regulator
MAMAAIVGETKTWEDQSQTGEGPEATLRPHLFLVLEGHRPLLAGARFDLTDVHEVVVGRGTERTFERRLVGGERQLLVRAPDPWLSTLHARLRRDAQGWFLEDAGSTNGTFIRDCRIERARLADGDLVQLGHCFFVFRPGLPTPSDAPPDFDLTGETPAPGFATTIPGLAADCRMLEKIGRSAVSVVLVGETGTGKEVLARALHALSGRKGPFVAFNCGAISESLREGQLFGHVRGAFTGAHRDEPGIVRAAHGGTLLLDEVVELDRAAQVALLRVLQERQVVPVGSSTPVDVDVRFVSAAREPLTAACDAGRFRPDLLARLDGFTYRMRPLRERVEDIGVCIATILRKHLAPGQALRIAPDAARALFTYDWPLNIRELEQCLVRSVALAENGAVRARDLAPGIADRAGKQDPDAPGAASGESSKRRDRRLSEADAQTRAQVVELLGKHDGNITEVARVMGKARNQVQRWLRRFEIDAGAFRRKE